MQIVATLSIWFSGFYFILLMLIIWALRQLHIKDNEAQSFISIVIAARNEAQRIGPTLESLSKLDYPADKHEIIFVDDASTDDTAKLIQQYVGRFEHWRLIEIKKKSGQLLGKKNALNEAIKQSRGELIFTTDADCVVPPGWLRYMSGYFSEETIMVLGHSPLKGKKGFLGSFLKFDNLFSAIVAAAPLKLGFPHTSVGRNLAYRKSVYEAVGGYEALKEFRSGDDVYLTELFRRKGQGKIDYCVHPNTFVETIPPDTTGEVFHQQIRKNSKTLKKSTPTVLFSMMLFVAYLMFMFLPLVFPSLTLLWLKLILVKFILEFLALTQAAVIFRKKELLFWFPFMQLIYPFYVTFFSILGALQIYKWKK